MYNVPDAWAAHQPNMAFARVPPPSALSPFDAIEGWSAISGTTRTGGGWPNRQADSSIMHWVKSWRIRDQSRVPSLPSAKILEPVFRGWTLVRNRKIKGIHRLGFLSSREAPADIELWIQYDAVERDGEQVGVMLSDSVPGHH